LQVDAVVGAAVNRIATMGFKFIVTNIDSLVIKKEAKVSVTMARGTQEVHQLADRVGQRAVIVFADPKEFTEGMEQIQAQADQNPLPLDDE
jgi:uncharacterized protein (DUF2141 family)